MRRASKTDTNQADIVDAARKAGASVALTHRVGGGFADLAWGIAGLNLLVEVKTATGELNANEHKFHADWRGKIVVVRTVEEAVAWVEWARWAGELLREAGR